MKSKYIFYPIAGILFLLIAIFVNYCINDCGIYNKSTTIAVVLELIILLILGLMYPLMLIIKCSIEKITTYMAMKNCSNSEFTVKELVFTLFSTYGVYIFSRIVLLLFN